MAEDESEDIVKHMQELSIAKKLGDREREGNTYYKLADVCHSQGNFKQVIEYQKLHLSIARELGNRAWEAMACFNLGVVYNSQCNFKEAIEYQKLHIDIAKELEDREGEGGAYGNLGNAYYRMGNVKQAIEYQKLHLSIAKELGDRAGEGRAYCNLGNAYQGLGNFKQAAEYHELDLSIAKELGDRDGEGRAYCNLGNAYCSMGNFKQAAEYHKLDLSIAKELGNRDGEGMAYGNLGNAYQGLGNFKQAAEYHELNLSIAKELGNKDGEGMAYGNLGNAYYRMGNFKQAAEYHELCLSIAKELGNRDAEGRAYGNLGNACHSMCNFKQATKYHELNLSIAKELGNRDGEGIAYGNLGKDYQCLGNFKQATKYHELHLSIAKESGNRCAEGVAYGGLGDAYYDMLDFKQAFECWKHSLSIAKEIGDRHYEGEAFRKLGGALLRLGDFKQSMEYMKQSLVISKESGDRASEGATYNELGNVYSRLGNFKVAVEYHKQSLSIAEELGDRVQEAQSCHSLGHNYESVGSLSEALDYYRSSVKTFDDIRALLQLKDMWKISFRDLHQCAYTSLWSTLVKTGETDEALCTAEQGRAQALIDVLKEKYGVDSSPSTLPEPKETITYILKNVTKETVFLALDTNAISFWLLRRGKEILFKQKEIEPNSCKSLIDATLRDIAVGVRVMCEDRSMDEVCDDPPSNREAAEETDQSPTSSLNSLRQLYDVIIGPIADLLEGDQLVLVPDGPFCLAPYSALSESIRIHIVPSLTALRLIADAPEDFHRRSGALPVGDPCLEEVTNLFGRPVWKQLPFARKEVEMIGKLLKTTPLTGRYATKDEVMKRLESVALVHIAAHGSDETGEILLAPNPGWTSRVPAKKYYILTMSDVQAVRLRARLVVLSCCHSGRGEVKSEGVVGIARAFLCAGARSVLVSLWAIDDEATMEFMKHFYQHLSEGKSASVALHQAVKSLRESEQFRDLKYWAPFVLIGDDVTLEFGERK